MPKYKVWRLLADEERAKDVFGVSPEHAAENFVSGTGLLTEDGDEETVCVRLVGGEDKKTFVVTARIEYEAVESDEEVV